MLQQPAALGGSRLLFYSISTLKRKGKGGKKKEKKTGTDTPRECFAQPRNNAKLVAADFATKTSDFNYRYLESLKGNILIVWNNGHYDVERKL